MLRQKKKRTKKRKATVCTSGATPEVAPAEGQELASLKQPALLFAGTTSYALRPYSEDGGESPYCEERISLLHSAYSEDGSEITITLFHWVEIRIRTLRVKDFVAIHYRYQVLGIAQVDDVVGITRQHNHTLNLVAAHLVVQDFTLGIVLVAQLDQTMSAHHDKLFPLGVMPVLALGDARLADVDAHLAAVQRVYQFGDCLLYTSPSPRD